MLIAKKYLRSGERDLFVVARNVNESILIVIISFILRGKEAIETKYTEYLKGLNKSPNTIKAYQGDIEAFISAVKKPLAAIKDTDISKYLNGLVGQAGTATRARKISALKSYFAYKVARSELKSNPAAGLKAPKREKRLPVYLNLDESRELLSEIAGKYAVRDKAILTLFLNCGLRLSELVSIDRSDIRGDTLQVIGKGNKERTIYLNKACLSALNEYLDTRTDTEKALFLSERKQRISNRTVQTLVKKHIGKAGLDTEKYSTHKLRHTAATLMYKHGHVDIRALQAILGHESISTTEIYTHVDDEQLRTAVNSNPLNMEG